MKKNYIILVMLFLVSFVKAQIINIPDPVFKARLLETTTDNNIARDINDNSIKIDINNDGEIQVSEILNVYKLGVALASITNLEGIQQFENLHFLHCGNTNLGSLDVSGMSNLENLYCVNAHLTSIDLTGCSSLKDLYVSNNTLNVLDLSGLINLEDLHCDDNILASLNVSGNHLLEIVSCENNAITTLDLSNNHQLLAVSCASNGMTSLNISGLNNLSTLACAGNELTALDVTNLTALSEITCSNNQLTTLDLTGTENLNHLLFNDNQIAVIDVSHEPNLINLKCTNNLLTTLDLSHNILQALDCSGNPLEFLNLKNGHTDSSSVIRYNCPTLQYICEDEPGLYFVNYWLNYYGITGCNAGSYCSFTPGGTFYNVAGNNKIDLDNNGCDAMDNHFPGLKFHISDGTNTTDMIATEIGNYSWPLQTGSYTITPIVENDYFTAEPAQFTVSFPASAPGISQDVCILPAGIHNDLEIIMAPINSARPGFNADYQLIFRNTGTTIQTVNLNLLFDDSIMDFVTSVPPVLTQAAGSLDWGTINIEPFGVKHIVLQMNLNSPVETPAVNGGDVIHFTASISSAEIDETPENNAFSMTQTVVNSLDPNDKTCLEGDFIPMSDDGQYIHYLIRFENTGTANAQNVVVKDIIDTTYLDPATLTPISSNYSFITRITDNNKVEFIFENINLPFADNSNDGYILFKIETKPAIALGSTFLNTASIYFDYNFPVITEPAAVTVSVPLGISDVENKYGFAIYPNPVKDVLNISSKVNANINTIMIYNTLGQEVMKVIPAQGDYNIDVSRLIVGSYLVKLISETGSWSSQIIKE